MTTTTHALAAQPQGITSFQPIPTMTRRSAQTLILTLGLLCSSLATSHAGSWITLFKGKITDQLRGYKQTDFPAQNWVVDGDALKTVPGKAVDLATVQSFGDFDLRFEWKVAPGGNSGVMYRVTENDPQPWNTGPEYQVLDDSRHPDGKNPKTTAGSLYALLAAPAAKNLKPVGEFNEGRIVFRKGKVTHYLNGKKTVEYTWGSPEVLSLVAQSKFKGMPRFMRESEGRIVFQHHGEEAWFRNMRIRKL